MSTIAAIATAQAAAGIGVVRVSGPGALAVGDRVFTSVSGRTLGETGGYHALFGKVHDGGCVLDEAVALVFRAPKSYTGEDVVEISCHGGLYVVRRVLRAVLNAGAVPAEPGEFTKRAFLNGKLDLSEAEAVTALIAASGEEARAATLGALDGALSREIADCRDTLARAAAFFAAWVDYPDDEIPALSDEELQNTLGGVRDRLNALLSRFEAGAAVLGGVDTVLVGRPNVGKSTLLNALSGTDRAIVTDVAGTTRDVLEETVRVGNVTLRLADTAGIRSEPGDEIEKIGVERARERMRRATLVLAVLDAAEPLTEDDRALLARCAGRRCVVVLNKGDLPARVTEAEITALFADGKTAVVTVSARDGAGMAELKTAIEEAVGTAGFDPSLPLLTTERQRDCVRRALSALDEALTGLAAGITADAVNVCVDDAVEALGALTGEHATDAVLNEVFKNFCVGK
ncbi:MAG: tRNA uridine-5-carboxymethylaminomethyl(34) synthesis GTPase MnmE [Clostridia bacterium]|nr:tRNA uridine-5-carboxymethylaminomethyl(34) synthesis GTPase MnmE [Clostridia bacterium]